MSGTSSSERAQASRVRGTARQGFRRGRGGAGPAAGPPRRRRQPEVRGDSLRRWPSSPARPTSTGSSSQCPLWAREGRGFNQLQMKVRFNADEEEADRPRTYDVLPDQEFVSRPGAGGRWRWASVPTNPSNRPRATGCALGDGPALRNTSACRRGPTWISDEPAGSVDRHSKLSFIRETTPRVAARHRSSPRHDGAAPLRRRRSRPRASLGDPSPVEPRGHRILRPSRTRGQGRDPRELGWKMSEWAPERPPPVRMTALQSTLRKAPGDSP